MKKLLSAILIIALVCLATGCSNNKSENGTGDITKTAETKIDNTKTDDTKTDDTKTSEETKENVDLVVAWWGSQARNDNFTACFDLYTSLHPEISIETQTNGFSDHMVALSAAAAGGTMPDLSMSQSAYLAPYVEAGQLLDLTPYIESGALDLSNVSDSVISTGQIGDGIYGISAGTNAPALIYNKTLTDSLGIEVKDLMTIEDFIEISREVYEKSGVKTHLYNAGDYIEYILRGDGIVMYEEDKLGVDSWEQLLPYFQLVETGNEEGWLMDMSVTVGLSNAEEQPIVYYSSPETQSWCSWFNSNQMNAIQAAAPEGIELAITTRPSDNPTASNYLRQSMCWTVAADSEYIDETIALLNWWINAEEPNDIILGEPGVPASSTIASHVAEKLDETGALVFNYVTNIVTPNSSASNPNPPSGASQIREGLIEDLNEKVHYGEYTAEQAAKELFEQGNQLLKEAQ